ncbi:MAG: AAA family ATPase [Rhodocyclaceae bacterium]
MNGSACADHERLVAMLLQPARYPHPVQTVRLVETHISSVLLTGDYAYKLKKPLDLGFLDFSTLAKRHASCLEEVRLNRRFAPEIYLGVVSILGSVDDPRFDGTGEVIEYAVKMREFPQSALLDAILAAGEIHAGLIDRVAEVVADFHGRADRAPETMAYGSAPQVISPAMENFSDISVRLTLPEDRDVLDRLRAWTRATSTDLHPVFARRKADGFVRECHGDLHLGNIAWIDGRIQLFDGIEFNARLRWIDVASDIAFLFMDLAERAHPDLAWRFLNRYLEQSGDYAAMGVLNFYLVYRAMVRAKVALIRSGQEHLSPAERESAWAAFRAYLGFASARTRVRHPLLIITHGPSASGKTMISQGMLERFGAIRLRADVERKRLHGVEAAARSGSPLAGGIYDPAATRRTYAYLLEQARLVLSAGYPVILDATFLARWQRNLARDLACTVDAPFMIVDCQAPAGELQRRVVEREREAVDASEATMAVLDYQMASAEPLEQEELLHTVHIDSARESLDAAVARIADRLGSRGGARPT